jgi:ABC-type bacteriocin/lantibiotic exporter with double-glycine peptidase domain
MLLRSRGTRKTQKEISRYTKTTIKKGTSTQGLLGGLAHYGFRVRGAERQSISALTKSLKKGLVVIVCYTERHWNWDHYAIVLAVSKNSITLLDPAESKKRLTLPLKEFKKRWKGPLFTYTDRWAGFVAL